MGQNFLTRPDPTRTRFFWPEAKTGWPVTRPVFCAGQPDPTHDPTRTRTIFLKLFFLGKKNSEIKTILVLLFIMSFKETIDTFT